MVELSISEAFEIYRTDYILFKNQSRKTEENNYVCRNELIRFLGDVPITDLTFAMVRDWKTYLLKTRTESTVRNYIVKLRVVLSYFRSRGYDVLDSAIIPIPQRNDTVVTFLMADEVARMIAATPTLRGKAIISLLYGSGIRLSELLNLDKSHVIDNSFTTVGKGGKARLCFLDERTVEYLALYLPTRKDNCRSLFASNNKTRMTATNVQLMVRTAAKRAGIDRSVSPHTLRHSFATNFSRNNGNMRHLQVLLGHNSLETTAHYAHVVDEDLRRAYSAAHSI
jgi:integrase/recombinase XerD